MSRHKTARVARVLSGALRVWGAPVGVDLDPERPGELVLQASSGATLRVVPEEPHGWLVFRESRLLATHAGLPGLLRTLRDEL